MIQFSHCDFCYDQDLQTSQLEHNFVSAFLIKFKKEQMDDNLMTCFCLHIYFPHCYSTVHLEFSALIYSTSKLILYSLKRDSHQNCIRHHVYTVDL